MESFVKEATEGITKSLENESKNVIYQKKRKKIGKEKRNNARLSSKEKSK